MIVVAEGAASGLEVGRQIKERTGFDTKVTILGHIQRGGSPSSRDRILASRLGAKAVELLMEGEIKKMVGMQAGKVVALDIENAMAMTRAIDLEMYNLAGILSI
jgi:6-phosphofructokinase 1